MLHIDLYDAYYVILMVVYWGRTKRVRRLPVFLARLERERESRRQEMLY